MAPDRRREDVGETAREVDVPESPGLLDAGPAMRHLRLGEHEQHAGESDQELTEDDEPHLIDADRPGDREVADSGDPHRHREHFASPVSVRKPSQQGGSEELAQAHHPHRDAEQKDPLRHARSARQDAVFDRMEEHGGKHRRDQRATEEAEKHEDIDDRHEPARSVGSARKRSP